MSSERITRTSKPFYMAECQDCAWFLHSYNALGTAARHSDAFQHSIRTRKVKDITYTYAKRGKADGRD